MAMHTIRIVADTPLAIPKIEAQSLVSIITGPKAKTTNYPLQ
jgi:hypothetical protein